MKISTLTTLSISIILSINVLLGGIPVLQKSDLPLVREHGPQNGVTHTLRNKAIKETVKHAPQIGKAIVRHPKASVKTVSGAYRVYHSYKKVTNNVKQTVNSLSGGG